jgi:hypothetical protein
MEVTPELKTEMTAPEMPKKTKLVSGKGKTYKIKIVRDCQVELADGTVRVAVAGEVVDVTKQCALDLLGTKISGYYTHVGEIEGGTKEAIYRAVPYKGDEKPAVQKTIEMDLDSLYESL